MVKESNKRVMITLSKEKLEVVEELIDNINNKHMSNFTLSQFIDMCIDFFIAASQHQNKKGGEEA